MAVSFENANWTIAMFNAGTASDYECERELMKIVPRFQGYYHDFQLQVFGTHRHCGSWGMGV